MERSTLITLLLLVGLSTAAPPTSHNNDNVVVTKKFFPDSLVKYKSDHDIVNILVPTNALNFKEDSNESSSSEEMDVDLTMFFVEADIDATGRRTYQGLYEFKNNVTKKILDNGRDAAASTDDSKEVFFGAQDGIYVYEDGKAVKYGSVTDSIIGIAKTNGTDGIYILTEDHQVFKVTEKGNKKVKVESVVGAQQIVLDYTNNLYFYTQDKQPYVLTAEGVKKIEGLPANPTEVNLIKPPFIFEEGVPFIVDDTAYIIYPNGTFESTDFVFAPGAKPTAYAMEATLIQYYAYDKKIYEYNILVMVLHDILDELKNFLDDKHDMIQSMASKTKRNFST